MCACGNNSSVQAIINSAYMEIQFIGNVVAYRGLVTNRLYGDVLAGVTIRIQVVDFDSNTMLAV